MRLSKVGTQSSVARNARYHAPNQCWCLRTMAHLVLRGDRKTGRRCELKRKSTLCHMPWFPTKTPCGATGTPAMLHVSHAD